MQKPSASLLFPFQTNNETDSFRRAETIEDTLLSAIRCFLVTRKGSRVGNSIGSFLPELLLQIIPTNQMAGLANELQNELTGQFPGVSFINCTFDRENVDNVSTLLVTISFSSANQANITNLTMSLPSLFSQV